MNAWETVIGLEVHVQLATNSKLFSGAATEFGSEPNRQACGVDLALPGVLPVVNREALRLAVRFGLAVGGSIASPCIFARKNYFYPDLSRGYQISQYEDPIVNGGQIPIELEDGTTRVIDLTRAHLEEDAGKLLHENLDGGSAVDFNRSGVPLLEIVSEPQMHTPEEATAYMRAVHGIVIYLSICDGNMEQGSFRCDANISVRRPGDELGTKIELKNINSFRFVDLALRYEQQRQIEVLEGGGALRQETRKYDVAAGHTVPMRAKECADDYRYFPDPDLLPVVIDDQMQVEAMQGAIELPVACRARLMEQYELARDLAVRLVQRRMWVEYFEAVVAAGAPAIAAAHWITRDLFAKVERHIREIPLPPETLAHLLGRIDDGTLAAEAARGILDTLWQGGGDVDAMIEAGGLRQVSGGGEFEQWVDQVIANCPQEVAQYRNGKTKLLGFLVGQVREVSGGKADPKQASQVLREKLAEDSSA